MKIYMVSIGNSHSSANNYDVLPILSQKKW